MCTVLRQPDGRYTIESFSLHDVAQIAKFQRLPAEWRENVLQLIDNILAGIDSKNASGDILEFRSRNPYPRLSN